MSTYSVAQAKNELPRLIDKVLAGEEVVITRRGTVVAELCPKAPKPAEHNDDIYARLRKQREARSPLAISGVDLIRQMRDEGY